MSPGGDLDRYFDFGENKFSAAYILFNVDPAFRRKDINNSTFKGSFDNIFINSIEELNPDFKVSQETPIEVELEYARLYDGELLNWGQVTVRRQEYERGTLTDQTRVAGKQWREIKQDVMENGLSIKDLFVS